MIAPEPGFAGRVVGWLRAGYPAGVPKGDYVALLGVLRRCLTDVEVHDITDVLASMVEQGEVITTADVERMVSRATLDEPSSADVTRVSSRLAAGGWPLADVRG